MLEAAELGRTVAKDRYDREIPRLRVALLHAQEKLKSAGFPVLVLINGADGTGKGEIVNLLHEWMDPRFLLTCAFGDPSREERERPDFWRFWRALPPKGRIGIFFGSWYSRPILRRVYGKIKRRRLEDETRRICAVEKELADDGCLLVKFWFHIRKKEQKKRLRALEADPATRWRVTRTDWKHHKLYDRFREVTEEVLAATSMAEAPWNVIEAHDRRLQALTVGRALLTLIEARLSARAPARVAARAPAPASAARPGERTVSVLDTLDLSQRVPQDQYEKELPRLQGRLNRLVREAKAAGLSSVLVFEGWDAAGKGSAVRRIAGALDARDYRIVSIAAPAGEEREHHYLWRFWRHLPGTGRVLIFDRSWYGRVLVERVEGFARPDEWQRAFAEINDFEDQLVAHGYVFLKFFLHVSPAEQLRRFKERERIPWKQFKITGEDYRNRAKWDAYEVAINEMVERTSTVRAPWTLVESNDKRYARLKVLRTLCDGIEANL
jgi:polyphosphate:AMP phosphotransferase